jgi:hypothetical protein
MHRCRDLTLSEILSDPLIRAQMAADNVDPRAFATTFRAVMAKRSEAAPPGRGHMPASQSCNAPQCL